jgi:putative ABC transport system ATP-binding protein
MTIVLVTHEADIAHFARRTLTFRDGRVTRDEAVAEPRDASEVLAALPVEEAA